MQLAQKHILVTGGTGTVGKVLTYRLLAGAHGLPDTITLFSRDEAKQYYFRQEFYKLKNSNPVLFERFQKLIRWKIGDVRDYFSVHEAVKDADIIIHAAAMKQVPSCEYHPFEAVQTNIIGAENIVRAVLASDTKQRCIIGISTDKACNPASAMGMSKALQEKVFTAANLKTRNATFACVRFGNLLVSRGSVVPMFVDQIKNGGPVTVTSAEMTRFLLPVQAAIDAVIEALHSAERGEIVIPKFESAYLIDVAKALIGTKNIEIEITGIRPGEKLEEYVVSNEEWPRTYYSGNYYFIRPTLSELINLQKPVTYLSGPIHSNQQPLLPDQLEHFMEMNDISTDSLVFKN